MSKTGKPPLAPPKEQQKLKELQELEERQRLEEQQEIVAIAKDLKTLSEEVDKNIEKTHKRILLLKSELEKEAEEFLQKNDPSSSAEKPKLASHQKSSIAATNKQIGP